jgi:hypothetical protein
LSQNGISLYQVEQERGSYSDHYTVRISIPRYDTDDPTREITGGSFNGHDGRGVLVRARVADLRAIARVILEAADQIEAR